MAKPRRKAESRSIAIGTVDKSVKYTSVQINPETLHVAIQNTPSTNDQQTSCQHELTTVDVQTEMVLKDFDVVVELAKTEDQAVQTDSWEPEHG